MKNDTMTTIKYLVSKSTQGYITVPLSWLSCLIAYIKWAKVINQDNIKLYTISCLYKCIYLHTHAHTNKHALLVPATPQLYQPNNNIQQNNTHTHETHIM